MSFQILKRVLPAPLKLWIRRLARAAVGVDFGPLAVLERQDAVFQTIEQRMAELERLCFDKVATLQGEVEQRTLPTTLERQDAAFHTVEQCLAKFERVCFDKVDALEEKVEQRVMDVHRSLTERMDDLDDVIPFTDQDYELLQQTAHVTHLSAGAADELFGPLIKRWLGGSRRVLDIGCGNGQMLGVLERHGFEATGVDLNSCAVQSCLERGLNAIHAEALEFLANQDAGAFDAMVCLHMVEHLRNRQLLALLCEAQRVLSPSGVFIVETPKVASLSTLSQYYFIDPTHRLPRHHDLFKFLMKLAGFTKIRVEDVIGDEDLSKLDRSSFRQSMLEAADKDVAGAISANSAALERNFDVLHNWLFVSLDVRLVGRKPDNSDRGAHEG